MHWTTRRMAQVAGLALVVATAVSGAGCSTAPKMENRAAFEDESAAAMKWFTQNVSGLQGQIDRSAAYVIFPSVGQWGILITGGKFGRGMLNRPDGSQIGWAAAASVPLRTARPCTRARTPA